MVEYFVLNCRIRHAWYGDQGNFVDGVKTLQRRDECVDDTCIIDAGHPAAGAAVVEEAVDTVGQVLVACAKFAEPILELCPVRDKLRLSR